jgi:hypothetical protein
MRLNTLALATATVMVAGALGTKAEPLFPYLDPVRTAVAEQLAGQPAGTKSRVVLARTLKLLDAPGKPTLAKDLKLLSVVGPALMKTSGSNSFYGPLNSAVDHYLVHVMAAADASSVRLAAAPPSQQQAAAQASLQSLNTLLAAINETSDPSKACKLLGRTAAMLASTDKLIDKALNRSSSTTDTSGQSNESSSSGLSWLVVSAPGATSSQTLGYVQMSGSQPQVLNPPYGQTGVDTIPTTGGLRVTIYGTDDGWGYTIRW